MKTYQNPLVELVRLYDQDVLTASSIADEKSAKDDVVKVTPEMEGWFASR